MKTKTLKAGSIVHLHGIPVELVSATKVKTASGNWDVISSSAAEMGRKGGSKTSEAKAAAVRENGKRGGRPRKTPKAEPPSEPANEKGQPQPPESGVADTKNV